MIYYNPHWSVTLGCDPELFVSREVGKVRKRQAIVGSELVLPEGGVGVYEPGRPPDSLGSSYGQLVRDGVQVELNPRQSSCRESESFYIQHCFRTLNEIVQAKAKELGQPLKIDMRPVVKLTQGDLN